MPSLGQLETAVPRCPKRVGSVPAHQHECCEPMFNDWLSEQWCCPVHGPMMTWEAMAARLARLMGRMVFEDAA